MLRRHSTFLPKSHTLSRLCFSWAISSEYVKSTFRLLIVLTFQPLVWGPGSELIGRRPIFLGTLATYTILHLGQSFAPNIKTFFVTRFLAGFFAVGPLTINPGKLEECCYCPCIAISYPLSRSYCRHLDGCRTRSSDQFICSKRLHGPCLWSNSRWLHCGQLVTLDLGFPYHDDLRCSLYLLHTVDSRDICSYPFDKESASFN